MNKAAKVAIGCGGLMFVLLTLAVVIVALNALVPQ